MITSLLRRSVLATLAAGALMIGAPAANAYVIDFDGAPGGTYTTYSEGGATVFALGGGNLTSDNFGNTPNGTRGVASIPGANGDFPVMGAIFAEHQKWVSIDLGDFDGDADTLFLNAFDDSNTLIASDIDFIPGDFIGMVTLDVHVTGIRSVLFGATNPALSGSSVYADNLMFMPEPGTLAIFGLGLVGLGIARRRRSA